MSLLNERYKNDGRAVLRLNPVQEQYIERFKEKCESKEYIFIHHKCECGSENLEVIAEKDRYGLPVRTVICRDCGLVMTDPRLDDKSNKSFYDEEYHYIYRAERLPSEEKFLIRKKDAEDIVSFIQRYTNVHSGKMLEIGCADGGNVAAFQEAGYDAYGIDLSHTYTEFGRRHGLKLECLSSFEVAEKGEKYDLIILNHVMEHFTDLSGELEAVNRLLSENGVLFVALPGIKGLCLGTYESDFLRMLQNAHIYNFTADTLNQVLNKHGFESIYCNEFIYGVFKKKEKSDHFVNYYPEIMDLLKETEKCSHDIKRLLKFRFEKILSNYKEGEVLIYGNLIEIDHFISSVADLSPVHGFFNMEDKSPSEVIQYIISAYGRGERQVRALILASFNRNTELCDSFYMIQKYGIKLYSLYSDIF